MLIDTHAHIDFDDFKENFEQILENAQKESVEKIIIPGVTEREIPRIIELVEKYDNLYAGVAIHPSEAKDWNEKTYDNLKAFATHPKVVAIGETGLDYYWDKTFNDLQQFVFKEHIRLAKEVEKPLIIHNREAHHDTLAILKETNAKKVGGVMHCFSGSPEFAIECVKAGFYIALGGVVTFKNAKVPKKVAQVVPLEWLLLETDSPYLTPHPFRGERNEPSRVKLVAQEIASIKEVDFEYMAQITTQNANRLFFNTTKENTQHY